MNPGIPEPPSSGPPPPPPPPVPGQVPALRISTASEPSPRRSQLGPSDPYEPPAAIQNAMMTKDKKPFTYTPGMGGKLDLSQIRSPRMARRVAKNANDEGIEGPPKSALAQEPRSPGTPAPMYACPPVAVPVFPQGMPQQPAVNLRNSTLPRSPPVVERAEPSPRPVIKVETKIQPTMNAPTSPETPSSPPTSPTQVTLAKAPTPWMQKQNKQQGSELPEWAKRSGANNRSQDSSSSGSESPLQTQPPQLPRQIVVVNNPPPKQPAQQMRPVRQDSERNAVPRVEDRPSIFSAMNESGHHQLMNSTPHHQSRWGNPVGQSAQPIQQAQGGAYIIPVQVDGQQQQQYQAPRPNANHNQPQYRNVSIENQANRNVQRGYCPPSPSAEPGPVQSKSFRVLQKITDTDQDDVDGEQLRKLQLTEDDRCLMNKFKEQVDGEGAYLHKEEDPRYRGAAIPSRAFRYLQNMTDAGDAANANSTPKPVNSAAKKQNRNSKTFDTDVQAPVYVPASEQQVQEPKKYMGGAIPSRSFRILQAMTAPESIATQVTQENRQDSAADFVSMPGNQQGLYYPVYPNPIPAAPPAAIWNPETGWWAYYPVPPHLYAPYDYHPNPYFYCYPQFYSADVGSDAPDEAPVTSRSSRDNINYNEPNDEGGDDQCPIAFRGNPLSRNSALYVGSQWRYDSSTTPSSCATTTTTTTTAATEKSSPLSSLSSEHDSESEQEEEEEESSSSKRKEENASAESSDSSCDSDSYLAYSTGLNPLKAPKSGTLKKDLEELKNEEDESNDSTDCEKESLEDDPEVDDAQEDDDDDEKTERPAEQEDSSNTTVSVSLPLRLKFSVSQKNEDVTTVIVGDSNLLKDVETCVNFTLKRPCSKEIIEDPAPVQPTFIVTSTDEERTTAEEPRTQTETTTLEDKRKTLLSVQSHSREEVTDDEDSGVTSDMSRIISEVDTDSECCLTTKPDAAPAEEKSSPVVKRTSSKYQRTQTHSRLFRLLSDEQLRSATPRSRLSCHEEHSSNSSGLDSPDCSADSGYQRLPTRPKSLDCEALFKRRRDTEQDSYYQTWKSKPTSNSSSSPRFGRVLCPRIKSAKNVPQTLRRRLAAEEEKPSSSTRPKFPLGSTSSIPSPLRTNRRC